MALISALNGSFLAASSSKLPLSITALVEDIDPVTGLQRVHACAIMMMAQCAFNGVIDRITIFSVTESGRVASRDKQLRTAIERPRYADALSLSAGDPHTILTKPGLISSGICVVMNSWIWASRATSSTRWWSISSSARPKAMFAAMVSSARKIFCGT